MSILNISFTGIQQAPAIGRALSELILDANYSSIKLRRFNFERIINDEYVLERNIVWTQNALYHGNTLQWDKATLDKVWTSLKVSSHCFATRLLFQLATQKIHSVTQVRIFMVSFYSKYVVRILKTGKFLIKNRWNFTAHVSAYSGGQIFSKVF